MAHPFYVCVSASYEMIDIIYIFFFLPLAHLAVGIASVKTTLVTHTMKVTNEKLFANMDEIERKKGQEEYSRVC